MGGTYSPINVDGDSLLPPLHIKIKLITQLIELINYFINECDFVIRITPVFSIPSSVII